MKIVLSGTDSLGFWFTLDNELYDRAYMIHTTFIPYAEHARLLKTPDIDEYIRFGGMLQAGELAFTDADARREDASFRTDESTRRYIDTAIAQNIQRSLRCFKGGSRFFSLRELYEAGELTNAINRIIEDMNHGFLVDVVTRRFKSRDLHSAADLMAKNRKREERLDLLDAVDEPAVTGMLMDILNLWNRDDQTVVVTDPQKGTCDICEIKHIAERADEQFRHLVDPEKCAVAEKSFGRITSRVVYYRGPDFDHASGVRYRNVENYLSGLKA